MIGFFQTWSLFKQNGFSISVIFPKSKSCLGTIVTIQLISIKARNIGAAINWLAFFRHRTSTF